MARTEYRFATGSQVGHDVSLSANDKVTLGSSVNVSASTTPLLGAVWSILGTLAMVVVRHRFRPAETRVIPTISLIIGLRW